MITAVHALVYAEDAEAARAFFRDVLGWPYVDGIGVPFSGSLRRQ
jgi:catechol 2,3-dioxygenase-like lactoylglutathione lyase family enzyme